MRAQRQHATLQAKVDPEAQLIAEDIERAVRSCMQQASIQSFRSEPNQSVQSGSQHTKRVSFEEWRRRKEAEAKLRKHLGDEVVKEVQEKNQAKAEEQQAKKTTSQQLVDEWREKKRKDDADKKLKLQNEKQQKHEAERIRREEANVKYREWLRDNYIKLQEGKRLESEAKQRNRQKQHEEAAHAEDRRRLAEATFLKWLKSKQQNPPQPPKKSPRETHKSPHLPFLLAYSPNRKRFETPSDLDYEDYDESESVLQDIRVGRSGERGPYSEESQFNEISSIRRNPMLLEQMQSIHGTESIDENAEEDDPSFGDDELQSESGDEVTDEDILEEELQDEGSFGDDEVGGGSYGSDIRKGGSYGSEVKRGRGSYEDEAGEDEFDDEDFEDEDFEDEEGEYDEGLSEYDEELSEYEEDEEYEEN